MDRYRVELLDKLPEDLEQQVEALKSICFNKNSLSSEQKTILGDQFCSQQDRFKYIVSLAENKPVGQITLFKRHITFHDQTVLLGGIGGVCTDPKFQKQGIATAMLQVAMQELDKVNCDIAYLCTDTSKLGKMYGRFGFQKLEEQYTFLGQSGKRYYEWDGMIAPITSMKLFEEILQSKDHFDIGKGNW